ncbi:MAG TPA: hypothetical protein VFA64_09855 [Hyphomicrobiaceae bacterium]|nr:hypothetical protein [Hyphomicrobiaceae bacterium]
MKRTVLTGLVSVGLVVALAASAAAHTKRYKKKAYYNSPSAIAERQRNARTFDETQYYEHNLAKIPLGTRAWWDQWERERGGDRP